MKIEITQYGHTASYEFAHEDVALDELISVLENLIKLTGYSFSGDLTIEEPSKPCFYLDGCDGERCHNCKHMPLTSGA